MPGLAGRLHSVALGTSVLLLPLHHPMYLAKQAATIQQLSGGRLRLGVGVGWHEQEYAFMGHRFGDRGARADESLQVLQALWSGDRDFTGRYWTFHDAYFGPLPQTAPQIWVGGNSEAAQQRAREHGHAWHPISPDPSAVQQLKQAWPAGRVIPRIHVRLGTGSQDGTSTPQAVETQLRELLAAGADGIVLSVTGSPDGQLPALRRLAHEVLPGLRT